MIFSARKDPTCDYRIRVFHKNKELKYCKYIDLKKQYAISYIVDEKKGIKLKWNNNNLEPVIKIIMNNLSLLLFKENVILRYDAGGVEYIPIKRGIE